MKKKVLAIIPARGGSKGIPKKNIRLLAGKPLIYYSIKAALISNMVSRVMVSTEDDEIAQIARGLGAEVPFLRPEELAGDEVHSVFPVISAIKKLRNTEGYIPDAVLMLLPTSPLTGSEHINEAVELFFSKESGSVISVCPFDKPLSAIRQIDGDRMRPVIAVEDFNVQRQEYKLHIVNASIYIAKPDDLFEYKTFHLDKVYPYIMNKRNSLDINDAHDFKIANSLISGHNLKNA